MNTLEQRRIQRQCGNKIKYLNKKEATSAAIKLEARYGHLMKSYECKYCHFWHIGQQRKDD